MQPSFSYYLLCQHGLILRRQCMAAGMTVKDVAARVRSGEWVVVRRGVYTTRARWESLDAYVGRPRLEVWAAVLQMQTPHIVSHDSAAYLHGLPILDAQPRLVHITRIGALGGRTRHGVKHHKAPVRTDHIDFIDDHPVLDIPRTVADIGREHGMRHAIVAVNSALRLGETRSSLLAAVEDMTCWPYVTVPRQAARWGDRRCENPGEDLTMLMLKQLAVGPVHAQFGIQERGRVAWVDFRVGRHLIEFDGRHKYRRETAGGYADREPEEVVWREKRRQDWLCGYKLGMSRVVWDDLQPEAWERSQQRLLREIADTTARFGSSIEDLAPFVIRRPRR